MKDATPRHEHLGSRRLAPISDHIDSLMGVVSTVPHCRTDCPTSADTSVDIGPLRRAACRGASGERFGDQA
jgi:hypothetical protein